MTKENEIRLAKLESEAGKLDLKLAKLDQFLLNINTSMTLILKKFV